METLKTTVTKKKIGFRASGISDLCNTMGMFVFLCLMLYFITMRAIGLYELFALRDFNIVFLVTGILFALSSYSKMSKDGADYLTGLKIGIRITLTAILPFALFIYFYLTTDTTFMNLLKTTLNMGEFTSILGEIISPAIAAVIIFLEGLLSGVIITFVAMQYYKK